MLFSYLHIAFRNLAAVVREGRPHADITAFTVSFQSIKAALTNPVRNLRSE